MCPIMLLKGVFLYVITTRICRKIVELIFKQFSDLLTQNFEDSEMGYWFVMCDIYMQMK